MHRIFTRAGERARGSITKEGANRPDAAGSRNATEVGGDPMGAFDDIDFGATAGAQVSSDPDGRRPKSFPWQTVIAIGLMMLSVAMVVVAVSLFVNRAPDFEAIELQAEQVDLAVDSVPGAPAGDPGTLGQVVSPAVSRIGGLDSPTAAIDGIDERVDVDIAVIDTGIDADHPDLNVAGGASCTGSSSYDDKDGHGTMVAGLAGAIDNGLGIVGVAPGARMWAVRVADSPMQVPDAQLACGLAWVADNADTIDVAVVSFGSHIPELERGCDGGSQTVKGALCELQEAGVTVIASAGNNGRDASDYAPAAYAETIAVSAFADVDGKPGSLAGFMRCDPLESDDALATYSNYGAIVDIAAPGACVETTMVGGGYESVSGTSFAAPLVAGAAGLYLANEPDAAPAEVRDALIGSATPGPIAGDPDGFPEPALNVAGL